MSSSPVPLIIRLFSSYRHIRPYSLALNPLHINFFARSCSNSLRSGTIMSTPQKWKKEKQRLLDLPVIEKRSVYKSSDYVPSDTVPSWFDYAREHRLTDPRATDDDRKEAQKIGVTKDLNKFLAEKVAIFKGDITKLEVDAIVNAANARLQAGGGVDGAIHRAAGPLLQEECNSIGGCPTGEAKLTGGYNLPAKYVIHTVGPQDKSPAALNSCYVHCFTLLPEYDIKTVAFPCISTGIYGFPNRDAAHIALGNARRVLERDAKGNRSIEKIIFCTFLPIDVQIYESLMQLYFPLE